MVKGTKPFRILSITCDDKSFTFDSSSDSTPKMLHLVPVSFAAGTNSGKVNRTIKIVTDLRRIEAGTGGLRRGREAVRRFT